MHYMCNNKKYINNKRTMKDGDILIWFRDKVEYSFIMKNIVRLSRTSR